MQFMPASNSSSVLKNKSVLIDFVSQSLSQFCALWANLPLNFVLCEPISLSLLCMISFEQGVCEPSSHWLTLALTDSLWLYLWLTLSLSLLLIPAHSDSLWLSLDRVPVSVSEWLFGSFVLILFGDYVYFSWFNSHISKEWDGNAV